VDNDAQFDFIRHKTLASGEAVSATESIASSAVKTARELNCPLIVVLTQSGTAARMVAKYRPTVPVLVVTADAAVARQTSGYLRNCLSVVVPALENFDEVVRGALADAVTKGLCKAGDAVVVVQGNLDCTAASTNLMRLYYA
jgi:pyruvate kinase